LAGIHLSDNYIFQQDSAPVDTAKLTLEFLEKNLVTFIRPHEWMPNSPDCDFWLWGYMKSQLKKKKVKSIEGLKKAIKTVAKNIPLDMIERAMLDWPKRCRIVNYARGGHIENFKWISITVFL